MKRYSEYKDSGVQWIGQIPSHWKMERLGISFSENKNLNSDLQCTNACQFNYGKIIQKKREYKVEEDASTYSKHIIISPKDIVINGLNLNYDFVSQRVAQAEEKGIITSAYISLHPRVGTNSDYFCLLLKAIDSMKLLHGLGTGIRLTLSFDELKKQYLPLPPLAEQQAIVDYLKEKTSKIEQYVTGRERERAV